ncbi:XRE family transcriptional regulator [Mucilaginibacter terrenus]|uniref:XRE family transcriptional regulator n=1 Tax=Mucilaginibacter terrenus TaxID=2482727 RepID=A0A3E2NVQ4_9SPHI|nr:helix-turn-helix transcriptional regulator [Mucilaginibacter terrenus]RFZ85082.1 XRE family transcriptional regulator [Mucilaginibacter terrenus]
MNFGERIRKLRESQGLLQRQLAADLEIDTPMFSKIERGERKAKREQVEQLAKLLHTDETQLLSLWLANQIFDFVKDERFASDSLNMVIDWMKNTKK